MTAVLIKDADLLCSSDVSLLAIHTVSHRDKKFLKRISV